MMCNIDNTSALYDDLGDPVHEEPLDLHALSQLPDGLHQDKHRFLCCLGNHILGLHIPIEKRPRTGSIPAPQ